MNPAHPCRGIRTMSKPITNISRVICGKGNVRGLANFESDAEIFLAVLRPGISDGGGPMAFIINRTISVCRARPVQQEFKYRRSETIKSLNKYALRLYR